VATGVAQTGANVMESIPAGVAAAIDGPNAAMQVIQRAGNQIPAIGNEFNRAAEGTVAVANGVLGVPRGNLPNLSMVRPSRPNTVPLLQTISPSPYFPFSSSCRNLPLSNPTFQNADIC
jgi:hypothetical protein